LKRFAHDTRLLAFFNSTKDTCVPSVFDYVFTIVYYILLANNGLI